MIQKKTISKNRWVGQVLRCLVAVVLTLSLLALAACSGDPAPDSSSTATISATGHAFVLSVSINSQASVYCTESGKVVDITMDNDDAVKAYAGLTWENREWSDCLRNMIVLAEEGGYLKDGGTVEINVKECRDKKTAKTVAVSALDTAQTVIGERKLTVTVQALIDGVAVDPAPATETESTAAVFSEQTKTPSAAKKNKIPEQNVLDPVTWYEVKDLYGSYYMIDTKYGDYQYYETRISEDEFSIFHSWYYKYDPEVHSPEDLENALQYNGKSYIFGLAGGETYHITELTQNSVTAISEYGDEAVYEFWYDPAKRTLTFTDMSDYEEEFLDRTLNKK